MKKILKLSGLSLVTVLMTITPALAELTIDNAAYRIDNTLHRSSVSQQQVPTDASLLKLVQLMRMDELMQSMANTQGDVMESVMQEVLQNKDLDELTARQKQQMTDVLTKYTQQMLADTNKTILDVAQKHFLVVAKNHYNQAEVDAQISFYSSDIGQSILDKQPEFMQEYMMAVMPETVTAAIDAQQKLAPKLKQELERILR